VKRIVLLAAVAVFWPTAVTASAQTAAVAMNVETANETFN